MEQVSLRDALKTRRNQSSFTDSTDSLDIEEQEEDEEKTLKDILRSRRLLSAQQQQVEETVPTEESSSVSLRDILKAKRTGSLIQDEVIDETVVEEPETPTQTFQRTGEVPEGFKAVPQVPTGDAPEDLSLIHI